MAGDLEATFKVKGTSHLTLLLPRHLATLGLQYSIWQMPTMMLIADYGQAGKS